MAVKKIFDAFRNQTDAQVSDQYGENFDTLNELN